ncbi:MAG: hypothetical protein AABY46_03940 [Nitrospirota bacterium]
MTEKIDRKELMARAKLIGLKGYTRMTNEALAAAVPKGDMTQPAMSPGILIVKPTSEDRQIAREASRAARKKASAHRPEKATSGSKIPVGKKGLPEGSLYRVKGTMHKIRRTGSKPTTIHATKKMNVVHYGSQVWFHDQGRIKNAVARDKALKAAAKRVIVRAPKLKKSRRR